MLEVVDGEPYSFTVRGVSYNGGVAVRVATLGEYPENLEMEKAEDDVGD